MKIDTGWHRHDEDVLNQVQQVQEEDAVAVGNIAMADVNDAAAVLEGNVWAVEEGPQEAPIAVADEEQFNAVYNGVGVADMAVGVNAAGG